MRAALPRAEEAALANSFVDHCDGRGVVDLAAFLRAFADLAEASHELWRRRGTKYPRLRPAGDEEVARFAEKQPSGPSTDLSL